MSGRVRQDRSWYGAAGARGLALAAVALLLAVPAPAQEPTVEFDPPFFYIGSFSTLMPLQSDMLSGVTVLRVLSDVSWQLELILEGPIRRTLDGLELPLSRIAVVHPQVPNEVANLQPYIHTKRAGSEIPYEVEADWVRLATGLQAYLDLEDPPGTYELTVLARLLDLDGAPLTGYASCTLQFDVEPWISFSSMPLPACEVQVPDGGYAGESQTVVLSLITNSSWRILVHAQADLIGLDGGVVVPVDVLSACVVDIGKEWRPQRSECETIQNGPVVLVVGEQPQPFSVTVQQIPVYLTYSGVELLGAGWYGTSLVFEAEVVGR